MLLAAADILVLSAVLADAVKVGVAVGRKIILRKHDATVGADHKFATALGTGGIFALGGGVFV